MFFGSKERAHVILAGPDRRKPYIPPVVLTQFSLRNVPVAPGPGAAGLAEVHHVTQSLTLSHEQNLFSFEFAALSYVDPQRNRYRYMLEALDHSWNRVDPKRRLATFTTLAAGAYCFAFRARISRHLE